MASFNLGSWVDKLSDEDLKRLVERVKKFENIELGDLPKQQIKTWLELNWSGGGINDLILPGSITSDLLGAGAVGTTQIADDSVTDAKLGSDVFRIIRGTITATGAITNGTGFTVTKGGTGVYTVNFSPAYTAAPSFVVMVNNTVGAAGYGTLNTAGCIYSTFVNGVTASNQAHTFIAIGPR